MRIRSVLATAWLGVLAAGCGTSIEEVRQETEAVRTYVSTEIRGLEDRMLARIAETEQKLTTAEEGLRASLTAVEKRAGALEGRSGSADKRIAEIAAKLEEIATMASQIDRLRAESASRVDDMKRIHETFGQEIGRIEARVRLTQDKYKEIIQKNIQSLKEQYTYLSNLLRQIESGEAGTAPEGAGGK